MGRKPIAQTTLVKATYCLKVMQGMLNKLKSETSFREARGFEMCMQIFEEHYGDLLKKENNDDKPSS
jgi:hypothetical protein